MKHGWLAKYFSITDKFLVNAIRCWLAKMLLTEALLHQLRVWLAALTCLNTLSHTLSSKSISCNCPSVTQLCFSSHIPRSRGAVLPPIQQTT
jgi:hypothetical protein